MRYVKARLIEYNRDLAYRIFVTDCVGHIVQAEKRWIDVVNAKPQKKETRSSQEIINNIKNGLNKIGE